MFQSEEEINPDPHPIASSSDNSPKYREITKETCNQILAAYLQDYVEKNGKNKTFTADEMQDIMIKHYNFDPQLFILSAEFSKWKSEGKLFKLKRHFIFKEVSCDLSCGCKCCVFFSSPICASPGYAKK